MTQKQQKIAIESVQRNTIARLVADCGRLEDQLRLANEQIAVLASILSDKADDAAKLFPIKPSGGG